MKTATLLSVVLLCLQIDFRSGEEVYVTAYVGRNVTLPCHSTDPNVIWVYQKPDREVDIYVGGQIDASYVDRFSLACANWYNLTINDVDPNDAGLYKCKENFGNGHSHDVKVNVSDVLSRTGYALASTPMPNGGMQTSAAVTCDDCNSWQQATIALFQIVVLLLAAVVIKASPCLPPAASLKQDNIIEINNAKCGTGAALAGAVATRLANE